MAGKHRSPPIFYIAAALLVMAFGVEIARIALYKETPRLRRTPSPQVQEDLFDELHTKFPYWEDYKAKEKKKAATALPPREQIDIYRHNPKTGPASAVQLVVFTDSSCEACREKIVEVLEDIPQERRQALQIIFKFFPIAADDMDGGIFDQLAFDSGVFDAYIKLVLAAEGKLETGRFVEILEQAGVPFLQQRIKMASDMRHILKKLVQDMDQVKSLGLQKTPVFYLSGYELGTSALPLEDIDDYVARLQQGKKILP